MLSYIGKGTTLFFFLYTLLVPYTITNSFADSHLGSEKKESVKKNNHPPPSVITKNIQMAGNILSSSPSELAEQAKSYAIGQFNSTVASGTQKWLSQFGTVRINFGLDKKGTLKNNSFDLLLPIYDNKADWLLFSQLGYRNKDSRNTMNLGLGGRYFYQDWMYGLNTFYDYDLTGKNQRLGLGGEIGGDYIKFSANTYYRLSNWKDSRDFTGYYERPANGYDINGEFFLPTYPHLGAKLSYQQYFGDDVTLFNRDTKQKNPVLATLGLSYTPVPLFTLGVDYKQGGSGHSETQFLANFNYKLGVPLSMQLSPENVVVARALAGSRYDLVERNNHIVLEHQKKPIPQLSLPETIVGYSQEQHEISVKLSSDAFVKQIHWTTNKDFEQHGGKLSSRVGHTIKITLPKYLSGGNQNNNYPIYALAELVDDQKLAPVAMHVIVKPFILKKQEGVNNFTPTGPLPATGNKKDGYTFDPVITFDTVNRAPIKNATISHVQWITDPKTGPDTGLQWIGWEPSDSVELDENGHFKHKPILMSTRPHKEVKVYLQLDSQPPQLVGEVSFDENPASFHIEAVKVSPSVPSQRANGSQAYTYSAVVLDSDNNPVRNQKIANVNWSKDKNQNGLIWNPQNGDVTTDGEGKLAATLASTEEIKDVTVSLTIGNHKPVAAEQPVSFIADTPKYHIHSSIVSVEQTGSLIANGQDTYTYKAVIIDSQGNKAKNQKIANVKWSITRKGQDESHNKNLIFNRSGDTTNGEGQLTATLASTVEIKDVTVSLSIEGQQPVPAQSPVTFTPDTSKYRIKEVNVAQPGTGSLVANGKDTYTYTAVIVDAQNHPVPNQKMANMKWSITQNGQDESHNKNLIFNHSGDITSGTGLLTATLASIVEIKDVTVSLSIEGQQPVPAQSPVTFTEDTQDYQVKGDIQVSSSGTVTADGQQKYTYRATIIGIDGNPVFKKNISNATWKIEHPDNMPELTLDQSDKTTDDKGQLTATLTSIKAVQGVVISLTVGKQPPVKAKPPVDFKSEQASITPTPPSPILVGKNYTLTVNVKDATGNNPEPNKKVNWTLKNPNQKGVTLNPSISTTQGDGRATTTLTSTQAQTVTVEASVEGVETSASVDVEFKWPTIQKPTVTEKTGTVPADGDKEPQHAYHYTAHVVGADGKTPYKEQEIKFKWQLKSQSGSIPQNTWLSETGEVTVQPDGTLKVQLLSSQRKPVVTGAIVCLVVVDENSAELPNTEQCSDPVDFEAENLKIVSLDVAFDPNHPLMGGKGNYTYTAKVVNADGTALPDGYKVEEAKWTLDPAPETYNGQAEWEIKGDNDNIVTNGQITATLSSQVGIGDINNGQVTDGLSVKLEVPAGKGKTTSSPANQQVAFEAPTLKAGLHVFSDKYPKGKIFKEQNKPYNTFQNLKGELVDASTEKPIAENSKSVNYDANPKVIDSGGTSIGDTSTNSRWDKGIVSFNFISTAVSNLKVITTVKKTNNAKYIYTYEFNVKRYFFGSPDGLITLPNDFNCTTSTGVTQKMTDYELYRGSGSDIDLITEFGDISKYGIAGNSEFIIGVGQSQNKGQDFIYSLKNNTPSFSDNTTPGYAMCVDHG
ncbi:inverse autotransporter beta domain-containing protein [Xenorhabdus sp. BG5]|uniref:inverse autotransporter beta domain-containing protein n=1 Tax=Xenorhabdus sp. BG5 TaxID=2782014 RepID=UPI00187F0EC6|nr:inverse autotransporter beta domain-containing protein [Xenorhabdus sp. BG5]MBE8595133.1 inverse autotransporter beta domain-containing protein [Xenorhabdus sp. BG5]